MANYEEFYQKSIEELTKYIKENKLIPTEKVWNKLAFKNENLTSQSLSYLSGMKFSDLCKELYQNIQKEKKSK